MYRDLKQQITIPNQNCTVASNNRLVKKIGIAVDYKKIEGVYYNKIFKINQIM